MFFVLSLFCDSTSSWFILEIVFVLMLCCALCWNPRRVTLFPISQINRWFVFVRLVLFFCCYFLLILFYFLLYGTQFSIMAFVLLLKLRNIENHVFSKKFSLMFNYSSLACGSSAAFCSMTDWIFAHYRLKWSCFPVL